MVWSEKMFCINKKDLGYIVTKYDDKFLITPDIHTSTSVFWRYDFSDIQRDDKIIDLGANIGGFAIAASHKVCKYLVMAIEPLRYKYLVNNININNSFVYPFHGGIHSKYETEKFKKLEWREDKGLIPMYSLSEMIEKNNGCSFLKCDIEGYEFQIEPIELEGIRRIEMQIHLDMIKEKWKHPLIKYIYKNYNVYITPNSPIDRIPVPPHPPKPDLLRPQLHCFRIE